MLIALIVLTWVAVFVSFISYYIASKKNPLVKSAVMAIIFSIIICVALYLGILYFFSRPNPNQSEMDKAYYAKDQSTCEKMSDQRAKAYCYLEVAKEKHDYSICERIPVEDVPSTSTDYRIPEMRDDCFLALVEWEDLSACDRIKDSTKKSYCYSYVARVKQDPSICDKIQDESIKDYCFKHIK
jgi:hypothetical protein